jgi:hypothetical protein
MATEETVVFGKAKKFSDAGSRTRLCPVKAGDYFVC